MSTTDYCDVYLSESEEDEETRRENTTEHGCPSKEYHVHEILGSVQCVSHNHKCHNHRFAAMTGEAEYILGIFGHVHKVKFKTDTYDGHEHEFCGYTGEAVHVDCGRHIHLLKGMTEEDEHHKHKFIAATLIENPTED